MAGLLVLGESLSQGKPLFTLHTLDLTVSSSLVLQGLGPTSDSLATNTALERPLVLVPHQVRLQVGGGGCAKDTLVTREVVLQGVVIVQDVAKEVQRFDDFNYFQLSKRRLIQVQFYSRWLEFFSFFFSLWAFSGGSSLPGLRCISFILGLFGILASYRSSYLDGPIDVKSQGFERRRL